MTKIARMLWLVLLLVPGTIRAAETMQWTALYQQQWHPSEQSIIDASLSFVQATLPSLDSQSLIDLSTEQRLQVAQAALIYLRGEGLHGNEQQFAQFAQLVIDLAIMLKAPLLESEGYYHLARDAVLRRNLLQRGERQLALAMKTLSAKAVADERSHNTLLAHLYLLQGQLQLRQQEYIQAIESAETTLVLSEPRQMPELTSNAMFLLGQSQLQLQQLDLAIEAFYQALESAEQQHDKRLEIQAIGSIGLVYQQQGNIKKAIEYLEQAAEQYQQLSAYSETAHTLYLLGNLYLDNQQLNQAMAIYLNALGIYRDIDNSKGIASVSEKIAESYSQLNEHSKAKQYFQEAKFLFRQTRNEPALLRLKILEAKLLNAEGKPEQALELLHQAQSQIKSDSELEIKLRNTLITLLLQQQQYQQASELMQAELNYLRSNMSMNVHQRASQVQHTHRIQLLQKQLDNYKRSSEVKTVLADRYLNYATSLFVIAVVAIGSLLSQWHKLRQMQISLHAKEFEATHTQFTHLGNARLLTPSLVKETLKLQRQQEDWYAAGAIGSPPVGKLLVLIQIPFLTHLYQHHGYENARKIEMKYGQFLRSRFADLSLYQPKDDIIALTLPGISMESTAERLLETLHGFAPPGMTPGSPLSIALMHYPFTQKNSKAVNATAATEILLLALKAAMNLTTDHQTDAWVGLEALESAPVSLFHSRPRDNTLLGINKGFIRVLSNHDKSEINWADTLET